MLELAAAATAFSSGGKPTPLPQRRRRSEHSHVRHCVAFSAAVCVNAAGGGRQLEAALEPEGPPSGGGVDTYWLEGVLPLLS